MHQIEAIINSYDEENLDAMILEICHFLSNVSDESVLEILPEKTLQVIVNMTIDYTAQGNIASFTSEGVKFIDFPGKMLMPLIKRHLEKKGKNFDSMVSQVCNLIKKEKELPKNKIAKRSWFLHCKGGVLTIYKQYHSPKFHWLPVEFLGSAAIINIDEILQFVNKIVSMPYDAHAIDELAVDAIEKSRARRREVILESDEHYILDDIDGQFRLRSKNEIEVFKESDVGKKIKMLFEKSA